MLKLDIPVQQEYSSRYCYCRQGYPHLGKGSIQCFPRIILVQSDQHRAYLVRTISPSDVLLLGHEIRRGTIYLQEVAVLVLHNVYLKEVNY